MDLDRLAPSRAGGDMDWRFEEGDWGRAGGNIQSLLFYDAMLRVLIRQGILKPPDPDKDGFLSFTWHDYGCAEGDGLALLQMALPMCDFKGFDVAPHAVARARERWPTLTFEVGDVTAPQEEAHIISSLHTLEHLVDPVSALVAMAEKAAALMFVVVPTITEEEEGGHIGAMLSKDFEKAIEAHFDYYTCFRYNTYRRVPGDPPTLRETNNLWIIQP